MPTRFFAIEDRLEAASQGKTTFYGKECRICGAILRYTSNGGCVACQKRRANERNQVVKDLLAKARKAGA